MQSGPFFFDADAPNVMQTATWNVALIADIANIPDLAIADIGKTVWVDEDGIYRIFEGFDSDSNPRWRADPGIRLAVEGPIVVTGNITLQFPRHHGARLRVDDEAVITLPANCPVGFHAHILSNTAETVTLAAGADVAINSLEGADTDVTLTQYGFATVAQDAIGVYFAAGAIAAVVP
jgi:hypothetical protein